MSIIGWTEFSRTYTRARACTLHLEIRVGLWSNTKVLPSACEQCACPLPPSFPVHALCVSWHVFNIKTGRCCGPAPFSLLLPCSRGQHREACEKVMLAPSQKHSVTTWPPNPGSKPTDVKSNSNVALYMFIMWQVYHLNMEANINKIGWNLHNRDQEI